jgi:hypothetical protein
MNRDRAKELLPVFTAFSNGEDIEFRHLEPIGGESEDWMDAFKMTLLDANVFAYRIKPKPREWWMDPDDFEIFDQERKPIPSAIKVREVTE